MMWANYTVATPDAEATLMMWLPLDAAATLWWCGNVLMMRLLPWRSAYLLDGVATSLMMWLPPYEVNSHDLLVTSLMATLLMDWLPPYLRSGYPLQNGYPLAEWLPSLLCGYPLTECLTSWRRANPLMYWLHPWWNGYPPYGMATPRWSGCISVRVANSWRSGYPRDGVATPSDGVATPLMEWLPLFEWLPPWWSGYSPDGVATPLMVAVGSDRISCQLSVTGPDCWNIYCDAGMYLLPISSSPHICTRPVN